MKKLFIVFSIQIIALSIAAQGSIGIGTTSPDSSAILDITSEDKGLLIPRMSTAQIEMIASPATGLQVYSTDDHCLHTFNGEVWMVNCGLRYQEASYPPRSVDNKSQVGDFLGRYDPISFVIDNKAYVGTGYDGDFLRDLHMYDQENDTWVAKNPLPSSFQERASAISFVIGDAAYVGAGLGASVVLKDLWKYDASSDSWTEMNTFPQAFDRRNLAVSFVLDNTAYVGLGYNNDNELLNDLWKYDATLDNWTQLNDFPEDFGYRAAAVSFVVDGNAYIGTGNDSTSYKKDLWKYIPSADEWLRMEDLPADFEARNVAVSFIADNEAYIGTGNSALTGYNDLWKYNTAMDEWIEIIDTATTMTKRYGAISFDLADASYIGLGFSTESSSFLSDVYKFNISSYILQVNSEGQSQWVNPSIAGELVVVEDDPQVGENETNYLPKWDGQALISSAILETADQKISIGTEEATHTLTLKSDDDNGTLRIIGSEGTYGHGGKLNFGDADHVYISEPIDDQMLIKANRIGINKENPQEIISVGGNIASIGLYSEWGDSYLTLGTLGSQYSLINRYPDDILSIYDSSESKMRFNLDGQGRVGIGSQTPNFNLHINEGPSDLEINSNFGVGMLITSDEGPPKVYFEDLDGEVDGKVMFIEQANGSLSFNSTNDIGTSFVKQNILNLNNNGQVGINLNTFNSAYSPVLEADGIIMANSFRDRQSDGEYFINPSASQSIKVAGRIDGTSFYDEDNSDFFIDPNAFISARLNGQVISPVFVDLNDETYFVDPSGTLSLLAAGEVRASEFVDQDDTYFFINPSHPQSSIGVQGDAYIGTENNGAGIILYSENNDGIGIRNVNEGMEWLIYTQSDKDLALAKDGLFRGQFDEVTGAYSWTSDRRLKDGITSFGNILPQILQLNPRQYYYKSDNERKPRLGFIAQEVEEIFPELVNPPSDEGEDLNKYYTLDYSGFGVLAIRAIQEQQAIIAAQASQISQLNDEIKQLQKLEARISKLEKRENR